MNFTEEPLDEAARNAVMDAFQKTMQGFLRSQQTVISRIFSSQPAERLAFRAADASSEGDMTPGTVSRYVMKARPAPLADAASKPQLTGLFLVTGEDGPIRDAVLEALRLNGASVATIGTPPPQDSDCLAADISRLRERHGLVRGIVHLVGFPSEPMPADLGQWRSANLHGIKSLFRLLQSLRDRSAIGRPMRGVQQSRWRLRTEERRMERSPGGGACAGILKTAAIEWPSFRPKAIDLDTLDVRTVAAVVIAELLASDGAEEIGYREGTRFVFEAALEPRSAPGFLGEAIAKAAADWVILATGGARGITAEAVAELLVPGMTLALVGRAPEPAEEDALTCDLDDVVDLRSAFLEKAKAAGQNLQPGPD